LDNESRLIYQVKVGEAPAFYDLCIASVRRYCKRYGIDHIVQTEPLLKVQPVKSHRSANALRLGYLPILEKSNAFGYLDRYDKIAVLDADIFVRDAPNLFDELDADFAAVLERDMPLTDAYRAKIRKYSEGQYRGLPDVDWQWSKDGAAFYNMGLMLFGQGIRPYLNGESPGEFVRRPEFERFVNGEGHWKWSTDQTLLNWWVKKSGMAVQALNWRWNALYGGIRGDMLSEAHFVHFFLSAKLPRGGDEIPQLVASL
jgi:hypothetical protein